MSAEERPKGKRFQKGVSGNPGGRPKKFVTLLSDALRESLGEVDPDTTKSYATVIAHGMVRGAAAVAKRNKLTKEMLWFVREVSTITEGKPMQKVQFVDDPNANPAKRIAELLASAADRLNSALGDE